MWALFAVLAFLFAIERFYVNKVYGPDNFRNPTILGRGNMHLHFDYSAGICALFVAFPFAARGATIIYGRRNVRTKRNAYKGTIQAKYSLSDEELEAAIAKSISLARTRESKYIKTAALRAVIQAESELNKWSWDTVHPMFWGASVALGLQGAVNVCIAYFAIPGGTAGATQAEIDSDWVLGFALISIAPVILYVWWQDIRKPSHTSVGVAQRHMVFMLLYACVVLSAVMFYSYSQDRDSASTNLLGGVVSTLFLPATYVYHRLRADVETRALKAIECDYQRYEAEWEAYLGSDTEAEGNLEKLSNLVTTVQQQCPSDPRELEQTTDSISEIYYDAQGVNSAFQDECQQWADETGGACHRCEAVKKIPRAINKVWRCYGGHPRRLTDVVRSSIEYSNVEGALQGLRQVQACPGYRILRIKNRFARGYDARKSAGYRDLSMNLRELGSGFVVELQFHLDKMIAIKSDEGHQRYVVYRDAMAE
jgi:hypothetical protein